MKNSFIFLLLILNLISCKDDGIKSTTNSTKSNVEKTSKNNSPRSSNDPIFISHEGISKAVTKQIWKEISLGEYNIQDIKLFDLGKQTSKEGEKDPYQIMTYGLQVIGDKEIYRISLRADLKDNILYYQLNEKQYYSCKEDDYGPDQFSYEMKVAISQLVADDYLKRKIEELNQ